MTKDVQTMSLLPFLSPTDSKIYLRIPQKYSAGAPANSFPFFVLNEPDKFSRLIPASFVSQSGETIKNIFLLIQRDENFPAQAVLPLDNHKIEELWQTVGTACGRDGHLINLSEDNQANNKQPPLYSPLFFCRRENIYFHPPCPDCGSPLSRCRDDNLLLKLGLSPFSTTLKKYLYCPSCASSVENKKFYIRDHDGTDPDFVLACPSLLKQYARLTAGNKETNSLPCITCQAQQECFGPDYLVQERIVPLSFYDFYLLVTAAIPLKALDFLAMTTDELLSADIEMSASSEREKEQPTPVPQVAQSPPVAEYRNIHDILIRLKAELEESREARIEQAIEPEPAAPSLPEEQEADDDLDKTMILNTADMFPEKEENKPAAPVSPSAVEAEDEDPDKTMIINTAELFPAKDRSKAADEQPRPPVADIKAEDDLEKTMIINTADISATVSQHSATTKDKNNEEEEDEEKTMILSAEQIAQMTKKR